MINDLWYKNAIVYRLSVGTYMDANGDGIGDFIGLTRRLDYLHPPSFPSLSFPFLSLCLAPPPCGTRVFPLVHRIALARSRRRATVHNSRHLLAMASGGQAVAAVDWPR